jgi:hypothetical protein
MPEKGSPPQLGSSISTRKAQSKEEGSELREGGKNLLRRTLRWFSVLVLVFPRGAVLIAGSKVI